MRKLYVIAAVAAILIVMYATVFNPKPQQTDTPQTLFPGATPTDTIASYEGYNEIYDSYTQTFHPIENP